MIIVAFPIRRIFQFEALTAWKGGVVGCNMKQFVLQRRELEPRSGSMSEGAITVIMTIVTKTKTGSCAIWAFENEGETKPQFAAAIRKPTSAFVFPERGPQAIDDTRRNQSISVAAFDLDSTLVVTKSGSTFPHNGEDWEFIPGVLEGLVKAAQTHLIAVFSNQGGTVARDENERFISLDKRVTAIGICLPHPVVIFCACRQKNSPYRKPLRGMWNLLESHLAQTNRYIQIETSYFVGDAAGRPSDFSDSDKRFAAALKLKFYTPEDWLTKIRRCTEDMTDSFIG